MPYDAYLETSYNNTMVTFRVSWNAQHQVKGAEVTLTLPHVLYL